MRQSRRVSIEEGDISPWRAAYQNAVGDTKNIKRLAKNQQSFLTKTICCRNKRIQRTIAWCDSNLSIRSEKYLIAAPTSKKTYKSSHKALELTPSRSTMNSVRRKVALPGGVDDVSRRERAPNTQGRHFNRRSKNRNESLWRRIASIAESFPEQFVQATKYTQYAIRNTQYAISIILKQYV